MRRLGYWTTDLAARRSEPISQKRPVFGAIALCAILASMLVGLIRFASDDMRWIGLVQLMLAFTAVVTGVVGFARGEAKPHAHWVAVGLGALIFLALLPALVPA